MKGRQLPPLGTQTQTTRLLKPTGEEIKCIIFDCDGVLVDSEAIGHRVLLSMAKEFGLHLSIEYALANFNGRSLANILLQIEELIKMKLPADFEREYRKQTFQAFKTELKPVNGVKEFLGNLPTSCCVASGGPLDKIILNLTTTRLLEFFQDRIFSSYEINSWKPEPDIFLFAAEQMGYAIDECIVIEDSLAGVIAAMRGGFSVYGYASENSYQELQKSGAQLFYSFGQLAQMLESGSELTQRQYVMEETK